MNPHDSSQEPDDFIIYPTDTLFGIIDDAADAERSLRALIAVGFTRDSVRIFCGETGAE